MRREDVQPLLVQAADRLPEPDLADVAWAAGVQASRRRRRLVVLGVIAFIVGAIVASILIEVGTSGNADITPPPNPPGYVEASGKISGIDFWVAPPPGSERFLDRLETPLGDRLELPDKVRPLAKHTLDSVAAVVLVKQGDRYAPVLLGGDGSWAQADIGLVPVGGESPLSPGAVSPYGRIVAFPQPGELITVNATTAEISHFPLPGGGEFRSVSWVQDEQRVLVSGAGAAYQVVVGEGGDGEQAVIQVSATNDPAEVTAPYRIQTGAVMRYLFNGRWMEDSPLTLPVRSWQGQTMSSNTAAARVFVAEKLPEVPTRVSQPQVLAAISTLRTLPSRLLVLGEPQDNPPTYEGAGDRPFVREAGCCVVLGWYDDSNVLFRVHGWVLAWNLETGRVRRVTEMRVDQVALGPGLRL
ncbi:hypothetical protein [Kribbella speibonae]|uniref:Uncharacterized protein n=1 Tax=Kribbella speibonae TaxID=1572660 RepID=A0A4R0ISA0_9ACTN|nr:hypothetical protein [Kribbella speibonae]TCC34356.1 hypothetical protein E0H92_30555 [Kribbella speibonae]